MYLTIPGEVQGALLASLTLSVLNCVRGQILEVYIILVTAKQVLDYLYAGRSSKILLLFYKGSSCSPG